MKIQCDPLMLYAGFGLQFRRHPGRSCSGPSEWSIRLRLAPYGAEIFGSRRMPSQDGLKAKSIERHRFHAYPGWSEDFESRLSGLQVPAFPVLPIGHDAFEKELSSCRMGSRVSYSWCACVPDEWEEMDALHDEIYSLFETLVAIKSDSPFPCSPSPQLYCSIAGTSHVPGIMELTKDLVSGSFLRLERDEGNKYDSNAVAVLTQSGDRIGFIPKVHSRSIASRMSEGAVFSVVVSQIRDKDRYRKITIHVIEHLKGEKVIIPVDFGSEI